mgnify:CR=1 FL=1
MRRCADWSQGGGCSTLVDWNALLGLMAISADNDRDPFPEAVRIQERLFTAKPITKGVEESIKHPVVTCGLNTHPERSRHVRTRVRQMVKSRGAWEPYPTAVGKR